MSVDSAVMAELEARGCTAALFVNGIPVSRITDEPDRAPREQAAADHLLVPGSNRVEIWVEPGPKPTDMARVSREQSYRPMSVAGRLRRVHARASSADDLNLAGDLLLEVTFEWAAGTAERMSFPAARSRSADLGAAHGRWAWQDGPDLRLDGALVDEACALLDDLDAAVTARDADRIWALSEPQIADTLRAYPTITAERARAEIDALLDRCARPGPVVPRDRTKHDFRLVAQDKLLELVDDDWSPSFKLVESESGAPFGFPMCLGRVGSSLRIVR